MMEGVEVKVSFQPAARSRGVRTLLNSAINLGSPKACNLILSTSASLLGNPVEGPPACVAEDPDPEAVDGPSLRVKALS
jgi:hypothetical protein